MIEFNKNGEKIILRNLQEQVQKNKEDIANHYAIDRALANFGIKIVGQVSDVTELPDPQDFEVSGGEYGDAYAVGEPNKYDFYIFTRPDPNASHYTDYWLNVGGLTIAGPQGPVGPKGEKGDTGDSTRWYAAPAMDYLPEDIKPGTMFIVSSEVDGLTLGDTYILNDNYDWERVMNLKGPQGPRGIQGVQGKVGPQGPTGPQGPVGPAGKAAEVNGILTNVDQLPDPASVARNSAYLIPSTDNPAIYNMWIIIGTTGDLSWENAGIFSGGTAVYAGSNIMQTLDSNNLVKCNEDLDLSSDWGSVYVVPDDGVDYAYIGLTVHPSVDSVANDLYTENTIPLRDRQGFLYNPDVDSYNIQDEGLVDVVYPNVDNVLADRGYVNYAIGSSSYVPKINNITLTINSKIYASSKINYAKFMFNDDITKNISFGESPTITNTMIAAKKWVEVISTGQSAYIVSDLGNSAQSYVGVQYIKLAAGTSDTIYNSHYISMIGTIGF